MPDAPSQYPVCGKITGADLSQGLELANKIATHCRLEFCPHNSSIILSANGDTDNLRETVNANQMSVNIDQTGENDSNLSNHYPLDYLCEIHEIIPDNATVDFALGKSQLMLRYSIVNHIGDICFILAESVNA